VAAYGSIDQAFMETLPHFAIRVTKGPIKAASQLSGQPLWAPWGTLPVMDQRKISALRSWAIVCVLACVAAGGWASASVRTPDKVHDLEVRAARLRGVVASVAKVQRAEGAGQAPVRVRADGDGAPADGPPSRLGWFDAQSRQLVVEPGFPASVDDALFGMVNAELRAALGEPAEPWFARGLTYVLTGSCAGFTLAEIESRTQPVSLDEVLEESPARSRIALAPAEARMARSLLVASGLDVVGAWKQAVRGNAELKASLRSSWEASLGRSTVDAALAYPRSVRGGVYVKVEALTAPALERDFARLASLGFAGVEFSFTVNLEQAVQEVATKHVAASRLASEAGLSVIWSPRWELEEDPLETLAVRRAHAVEGLSWIAEQGRVDGVVLFDSSDLRQPEGRVLAPESRITRRLRRLSLESSRPFAGDRLAFANDAPTAASARDEDFSAEFVGALAVIQLKVGILDRMDRPAVRRAGAWGAAAVPPGLSSLSDDELRAIAGR
jgi:hypothetical protein